MCSKLLREMKKAFLRLLCCCLALVLTTSQADTLAITGGTLIDGTGAAPIKNGTLLIEGERIKAIGPASKVAIPAGSRIIDAKGKFIIPGLIDANLHLFLNIDAETLIKYEDRYDEIILEAAQLALKSGQTTVFDTWGPRDSLIKTRDRINAGEAVGSRIFLAGNIIGFDGPISADFLAAMVPNLSQATVQRINKQWQDKVGRELMWQTPDTVREAVRDYAASPIDFLKYGGSGHTEMQFIQFSPRVQKAIVEEGHRAGKTVQVHTTSVESLDMAIDAGVDILTHCDISGPVVAIPPETIRKMVEQNIACSILPITQARLDALLEKEATRDFAQYMKIGRQNEQALVEAGVTLLLSTDSGVAHPILTAEKASQNVLFDSRTNIVEGLFNALTGLEELGMDPMDILQTTTSNIARAYNHQDDFGTLQPGLYADVVILDKNPLKGARNYRSIHQVIKQGSVIDRDSLPTAPLISNQKVPEAESTGTM